MDIEVEKSELVNWIKRIKDSSVLEKIIQLKNKLSQTNELKPQRRDFGDGKHIFTYIADDFNEPLDDFKEYME